MKRKTFSVLAIVFLGLFIALALFQLVFWRQIVEEWGGSNFHGLDSVNIPIRWKPIAYIAAAVSEIVLLAKGKNHCAAAAVVPAAAWLIGNIIDHVQFVTGEDMVYRCFVLKLNSYFINYIEPIFTIGAALAVIAAFADKAPRKFLPAGIVCVSIFAVSAIILMFPFSPSFVQELIYALGYLIPAILLIIAAVRKSKVLAAVSGVFYALCTLADPYVMSSVDNFIYVFPFPVSLDQTSLEYIYTYQLGHIVIKCIM